MKSLTYIISEIDGSLFDRNRESLREKKRRLLDQLHKMQKLGQENTAGYHEVRHELEKLKNVTPIKRD